MQPAPDDQGFTLIEVLAAMLLLSMAYVAILESFSSSMSQISKLDHHYEKLLSAEQNILAEPLIFTGATTIQEGDIHIEGRRFDLLRPPSSMVETLILVPHQ